MEVGGWVGDHPNNSIIENVQNTEKSPGDLRRLAVIQSPVKDHQLTLMWKILMCNTNTGDTNEFISFYPISPWWHEDRDTNHRNRMLTILCRPPPTHAWRILWCLRSQFFSASRDPKNMIWSDLIRPEKLNHYFQRSTSTKSHFKIFQFSGPSLLGLTSFTQASFPVWECTIAMIWLCVKRTSNVHKDRT